MTQNWKPQLGLYLSLTDVFIFLQIYIYIYHNIYIYIYIYHKQKNSISVNTKGAVKNARIVFVSWNIVNLVCSMNNNCRCVDPNLLFQQLNRLTLQMYFRSKKELNYNRFVDLNIFVASRIVMLDWGLPLNYLCHVLHCDLLIVTCYKE